MKKTIFKNVLSFLVIGTMVLGSSKITYAKEKAPQSNTHEIQITEEYIKEYGRSTVDEFGNNIIEVPLGPSIERNISNIVKTPMKSSSLNKEDVLDPNHFSLTPHVHEIVNLRNITYSNTVPVTQYAYAGFTITKEYSKTIEVNASLNLTGGITKGDVEGQLGVSVGGSYTRGASESYSAVVPSGYRGRIAYRYYSTLYMFDVETTYVYSTIPITMITETNSCSAESEPYDGYFYLQLLAV